MDDYQTESFNLSENQTLNQNLEVLKLLQSHQQQNQQNPIRIQLQPITAHIQQQQQHQPTTTVEQDQFQQLQDEEIEEVVDNVDPDKASTLIELIRQYHCVWDVAAPEYKDIHKKTRCWNEVAKIVQCPVEVAKAAWENLRANYRKCLQRRDLRLRSGAGAPKGKGKALPTCAFFEELTFLKSFVENCKTTSNITLVPQQSSEGLERQYSTEALQQQQSTQSLQRQTSSESTSSAAFSPFASPPSDQQLPSSVRTQSRIQSSEPINGKRKRLNTTETPPSDFDRFLVNTHAEKRAEAQVAASNLPDLADPDVLYCLSMVKDFKKLSQRKKLEMKIKNAKYFLECLECSE